MQGTHDLPLCGTPVFTCVASLVGPVQTLPLWECIQVQGYLITSGTPCWDHHEVLGIPLLSGPTQALFLMSEVTLCRVTALVIVEVLSLCRYSES